MVNIRSLWSSVSKINFLGVRSSVLQVRHQSDAPATPLGPAGHYENDKWVNAWMKRDVKRRRSNKEWATMRVRLLAVKRCTFLPKEITEIADRQMIEDVPRMSSVQQLTNRCALTSRGRGVVQRWRLSRFVFRHMADYNKIAGIQRAIW